MSTTFGIILGVEDDGTQEIATVAFQSNRGMIYFTNLIAHLLPDKTEVTALDNDSDIKTIGDIKRMINDNISSKA